MSFPASCWRVVYGAGMARSSMIPVEFHSKELAKTNTSENGLCLAIQQDITYDDWEALGCKLARIGRAYQWWIGDWLLFGEARFGEKYAQAIESTGLAYQTVANCRYIAGHFDFSRRREKLSWGLHADVAGREQHTSFMIVVSFMVNVRRTFCVL